MKFLIIAAVLAVTACTPARIATEATVKTGRVVLGAADLIL